MTKMRVHELAKEFGIASKEMEAKIKEMGYSIKNYMSTLEDYEVEEIRRSLRGGEAPKEEKPKVVVRRKHQVVRLKKVVRRPKADQPSPEEESRKVSEVPSGEEIKEPTAPAEVVETKEAERAKEAETAEVRSEAEVGAPQETEEAAKPEPAEPKSSKSLVKIIDRRVDLVKRPVKREEKRQVRHGEPREERPRHVEGPGVAPPTAESVEKAAAPSKKAKKKGKRVVDMADMDKRRRRQPAKVKEKPKPINKLLVEEVDVELPEEMEFVAVPQAPVKKGGKGEKAKEKVQQVQGTVPIKSEKRRFAIYETIQVGELAKRMSVKASEVIKKLMEQGVMATVTQALDYDTAALIASEFGYEVERKAVAEDLVAVDEVKGGEPKPRPPVVTVMGHVDHGKTTLLDAIRNADVAAKEAGGITQHIGAYHVRLDSGEEVVFLDTPGHEAFTAMRARGAKVTDIVILVVAADDGVMAQTKESIDHARAAGVPIIVAVNKIDKPEANPDRVKSELSELGLVPEEWGGDTIFVNISAKKNIGIEELIELLSLQAEVLELKADPERPARGHVVEARLDKGRGPVATFLVQEGTLKIGDAVVCDMQYGKIRAMLNDKGERVKSAGPSTPVEVQGLSGVPEAGTEFVVLPDEKKAREVAEYRQRKAREAELVKSSKISLESMLERLEEQDVKVLNIVLKTDVQGSLEALGDALRKLSTSEIKVEIVRSGIGAISESDVLLASASNAVIIGFNVKPSAQAKALAEREGVDIRFYDVIYNALDEIKAAMAGMLEPEYEEHVLGRAEVRQTFRVPKVGTVAGCYVLEGVIQRNSMARLLRDNVVVYSGKLASLRRFKEDVKEVQAGYECGIGLEKFNDIKVGDVIEAYEMREVKRELGDTTRKTDDAPS